MRATTGIMMKMGILSNGKLGNITVHDIERQWLSFKKKYLERCNMESGTRKRSCAYYVCLFFISANTYSQAQRLPTKIKKCGYRV